MLIFSDGFFIEAGAHDFQDQSTSLYFELKYNWTVSSTTIKILGKAKPCCFFLLGYILYIVGLPAAITIYNNI